MLVRTLTRACGRLSFEPDREIDLSPADAEQLAAAGAVQIIEVVKDEPKTDSATDDAPSGDSGRAKTVRNKRNG